MKTLNAKDAKYGFGRLIDMARAEPVLVAKHGRPVVVVLSVEEYERLKSGKGKNLTKSNTARPMRTEEN
jgi:prevent-host-death family protein